MVVNCKLHFEVAYFLATHFRCLMPFAPMIDLNGCEDSSVTSFSSYYYNMFECTRVDVVVGVVGLPSYSRGYVQAWVRQQRSG